MRSAQRVEDQIVLVVEDTAECRDTLDIALGSMAGCKVCFAASAEEALAVIGREPVAALITDLHLAAMDGLELVAQVRRESRYAAIPILVISGDSDPGTPHRALRAGANAYFTKPYSPGAVRQKLEELFHVR